MQQLEELITHIYKSLCSRPEAFELHAEPVDDGHQININVASEDRPLCIGYQGTTADAIRRIANVYAKEHGLDTKIYICVDAPPLPKQHFYE